MIKRLVLLPAAALFVSGAAEAKERYFPPKTGGDSWREGRDPITDWSLRVMKKAAKI